MVEEFIPLGEQPPKEIVRKLREIGDEETARLYEIEMTSPSLLESLESQRYSWLNKGYQYGFIPLFEAGEPHFHDIISASNMPVNETLKNQRINVYLHKFYVHEYPKAWTQGLSEFFLGQNVHTILFTFEADNQVGAGQEKVAFNQVYEAVARQDAGVTGHPIFIGLQVGQSINFTCKTVNVGNSHDQMLVNAFNSNAVKTGLHLLTIPQPGLTPFVHIAQGLATAFANRSTNMAAQKFELGLDTEKGAIGIRLDIGTYIAVQVPKSATINWKDWCYDANTDTVARKNLAEGEEAYILPHNTIMFRISKYQEPGTSPQTTP